jgi:hypothetical protein
LSDEDFDDEEDDEEDEEDEVELSAEQKAERMANIVPALPAEEWGRKSEPKPRPKRDVEMENGAAATASSRAKVEAVPTLPSRSVVDQIPSKIRPPRFAKQEYDGVISESDSDDEDEVLPPPGTLGRRIAEMKWAEGEERGARIEEIEDEDEDEAMEKEFRKEKLGWEDDFDEKMRQRVWGEDSRTARTGAESRSGQGAAARGKNPEEMEEMGQTEEMEETEDVEMQEEMDPDMEEEFEGFLKFSRDALGINDEMWNSIIKSRESRGGESATRSFWWCAMLMTWRSVRSEAVIRDEAERGDSRSGQGEAKSVICGAEQGSHCNQGAGRIGWEVIP